MGNEKIIDALRKFVPANDQEIADKDLFISCAENMNDCTLRENKVCHFSSSAFVINKSKTKVVSAWHNIYKSWGWLGGHVDGDTDLLAVAKREVEEESGITNVSVFGDGIISVECLPVFGHVKKGKYVSSHLHLNVTFVFVADEEENVRVKEDENSDIAWLYFDELIERSTEEVMIQIYKKIIKKIMSN